MQTEKNNQQHIYVHGAQDSSSFILLYEHSKVFKIIYTNCPGNICSGNICPGKWLSVKRLVREIIDESGHADVQETSFLETSCPGKWLSGKGLVRETSCLGNMLSGNCLVWERSCPGNVLSRKRLSGKVIVRETSVPRTRNRIADGATYIRLGCHHVGHRPTF